MKLRPALLSGILILVFLLAVAVLLIVADRLLRGQNLNFFNHDASSSTGEALGGSRGPVFYLVESRRHETLGANQRMAQGPGSLLVCFYVVLVAAGKIVRSANISWWWWLLFVFAVIILIDGAERWLKRIIREAQEKP